MARHKARSQVAEVDKELFGRVAVRVGDDHRFGILARKKSPWAAIPPPDPVGSEVPDDLIIIVAVQVSGHEMLRVGWRHLDPFPLVP